jgi:hypothetical protein
MMHPGLLLGRFSFADVAGSPLKTDRYAGGIPHQGDRGFDIGHGAAFADHFPVQRFCGVAGCRRPGLVLALFDAGGDGAVLFFTLTQSGFRFTVFDNFTFGGISWAIDRFAVDFESAPVARLTDQSGGNPAWKHPPRFIPGAPFNRLEYHAPRPLFCVK